MNNSQINTKGSNLVNSCKKVGAPKDYLKRIENSQLDINPAISGIKLEHYEKHLKKSI